KSCAVSRGPTACGSPWGRRHDPSLDCRQWLPVDSHSSAELWCAAFGPAGGVVGGAGGTGLRSADGVLWATIPPPTHRRVLSVVATPDGYIAVGDGGLLLVSSDGATWTTQASPTNEELFGITFGSCGFVAVAGVDAIAVSADGHEWTTVSVTG